MEDDIKKYVERAADLLAKVSKQQKSNLKSPEEAAKELIESKKNLKTIKSKFQTNSIDILYNYIKSKYPDDGTSENAEKLIEILKRFSVREDEKAIQELELVYQQLILEMQKIENKIQASHPEYKKKFT